MVTVLDLFLFEEFLAFAIKDVNATGRFTVVSRKDTHVPIVRAHSAWAIRAGWPTHESVQLKSVGIAGSPEERRRAFKGSSPRDCA